MDPVLGLGAVVALFVVLAVALSWGGGGGPGEHGRGPDYQAMAEIEARDTDDMLDGIAERRRRRGGRGVGEELADELTRGTWERHGS